MKKLLNSLEKITKNQKSPLKKYKKVNRHKIRRKLIAQTNKHNHLQ